MIDELLILRLPYECRDKKLLKQNFNIICNVIKLQILDCYQLGFIFKYILLTEINCIV